VKGFTGVPLGVACTGTQGILKRKCEGTKISEEWSVEVIPIVHWKGHVAEDLSFWRKSLWEKRGHVERELVKAEESEFI
jgi:hypothetical protein